jgi:hypothetical protein
MRERPDKFPDVNLEATLSKIKSLAKNHKTYDEFLIWFIKSIPPFYVDIDPANKKYLEYDEFSRNLSRHVKLSNPESYSLYKSAIEKDLLDMKKLFKVIGGA